MGQHPSGLKLDNGKGCLGRKGHVGRVSWGRGRMLPIGCSNLGHRTPTSLTIHACMRHVANNFDNLCDDMQALVLDKGCQHLSILKNII